MANLVCVSLTPEEIQKLQYIKQSDGLGASSVMRVGINHTMNKPRIQAEQEELKLINERLAQKVQKLAKRVYELETGGNENVDK